MADFAEMRARMVEEQLWRRGIHDRRVLDAMGEVPREEFVPADLRRSAYADSALPIGGGQTISQPWIVAAICQALALEGSERVLEVGTGSGYSAAVLSRLASEVIGVERHEPLAQGAAAALVRVGADNVRVLLGDGSRGDPEEAPFEAIAVHASAPAAPPALISQLTEGGRLVVPIAGPENDDLTLLRRTATGIETTPIAPCRFVPLIGEQGF